MKPEYKSIDHGSTVVTVNNKMEYDFVNSWGESNERLPLMLTDVNFPVHIGTGVDGLTWTNHSYRALHYISFSEFLSKIGYSLK